MPLANPQASVKVNAQLLPSEATEPNVGKELSIAIDRALNLSPATVAYCVTIDSVSLASGEATYSLNLMSGVVSGVVGSANVVRSGRDPFGNNLPGGQSLIHFLMIEADSGNEDPVEIVATVAGSTFKNAFVQPGKFILTDSETAGGNALAVTMTAVGDKVKITIFSSVV